VVSSSPDISERTIIDLSGRLSTYYDLNANAFDIAIGGMPFIMAVTDNTPYKRQTAEFRAQRVDQMRDPGEHTLGGSGYWTRAQSSFHYGEGILYTEPLEGNDMEVRFRYRDSYGVNVWTPGEVSLLRQTNLAQAMRGKCTLATAKSGTNDLLLIVDEEPIISTTTTASAASGSTVISVASTSGIVLGYQVVDGANITSGTTVTAIGTNTITITPASTAGTMASATALRLMPTNVIYKITTSSTSTAFITYAQLGSQTILSQTSDGSYLYVATPTNIYDINLSTGAIHDSYTINTTNASDVSMKYVKSRVIAGITRTDGTVACYELTFPNKGSGASINISTLTAINGSTSMTPGWVWTNISEAANAIYLAGKSGEHSIMFKLTVSSATGALETIVSVGQFPRGEVITGLYSYLGTYLLIGTSKGARVGQTDANGDMSYGPLVYHNENGVYDFEARDSYVWMTATNGVNAVSGTYRINLAQPITLSGYAQPISTGVYAKASDVFAAGITGTVNSVRIFDTDNRVAFAISGSGVWIEHATNLVDMGWIRTGRIRYDTMENKAWKRIRVRTPSDTATGDIQIFKIGAFANISITTFLNGNETVADVELNSAFPELATDASFKIDMYRDATDATTGAVINGIAVKALPSPTRARVIQIPLFLYDRETDKTGSIIGYEGYARERLFALETIESTGKTIVIQDFTANGEPIECIIEQITFTRATPSARNYTGFGGILQVIARTVV
jgi:hypothetical protein